MLDKLTCSASPSKTAPPQQGRDGPVMGEGEVGRRNSANLVATTTMKVVHPPAETASAETKLPGTSRDEDELAIAATSGTYYLSSLVVLETMLRDRPLGGRSGYAKDGLGGV